MLIEIAKLAERIDFDKSGLTATIVVFLPNFAELSEMLAMNSIPVHVIEKGNYRHLVTNTDYIY